MSLLIVTAYCESDAKQCIRLYKWIGQLGGIPNNRVLFVTDRTTKPETIKAVCDEAKPICAGYETLLIGESPVGVKWPRGANWAFMQASKKVLETYKTPFLWLEPDCSPTKKGWLEALEKEYEECGKPYMGSKMKNKPPLPETGMWGIAVYHPDVYSIFMETTSRRMNIAFDVTMAEKLVPQAHDTKLIQCINGPGRQPQRVKPEHIKPETVLLHQDKWGDVIGIRSGLMLERKLNTETCMVQLGRVGDILNVLPIIKRLSEEHYGDAIPVYVHKSMARVLDRVHYAKAMIVDGDINDPDSVANECRKTYKRVFVPQVFSRNGLDITGPSFNIAHFKKCGFEGMFPTSVMEIDNRDFEAEEKWIASVRKTDKPLICFNLKGQSSPFPHEANVRAALEDFAEEAELLDLNEHKTECITDQLIALDQCAALVTIDTASLHLGMASSCPILAYISNTNDNDWFGTVPMRPLRWSCRYRDASMSIRTLKSEIHRCIEEWQRPQGVIIHAASRREKEPARVLKAERSWKKLYIKGLMIPFHTWKLPRSTDKTIGDPRVLPYLRDPLVKALEIANHDDIIMFTNDDLAFDERTLRYVRWRLKHVPLVTSSRLEVENLDITRLGLRHAGRDLMACKAQWLKENIGTIPDFCAGASEWDLVVAALARKLIGIDSEIGGLCCYCGACELPIGTLWHEKHEQTWNHPDNVDAAPSQQYNRLLAEEWLRHNTPNVKLHWFKNL